MKEDLLQYIGQFQYFNNSELLASSGEMIQIINTGTHNTNQGADFLDAKIKIHESEHLFSKIKDSSSLKEVKKMLEVSANDYWHYHYVFDETSEYKVKTLGKQMIDNIMINTIIPVLFAYGLHYNEQGYKDRAIKWLEEISAEKNSITKGFENLNFSNKNAFDSQSFIQLKNEYCNKKLCLHCAIGNSLLKRSS